MAEVEIREPRVDEWGAIQSFLLAEGKGSRLGDRPYFDRLMRGSHKLVVAVDTAGDIVGFARSICDGVSNGYISLMQVRSDRRGLGIGGRILKELVNDDPRVTWVLRAAPESREFWTKMGFSPSTWAMERLRKSG